MKIRPCIDLQSGRVKQIIGSTLTVENFVSDLGAEHYARIYRERALPGGHVILLDPSSDAKAYAQDLAQARSALQEYPGGMQAGGGVTAENAGLFLSYGASHVIVTSYVFHDGIIDRERLQKLQKAAGRDRIVLDLSCRRMPDGSYQVVSNRWQVLTGICVNESTLEMLAEECGEFLIHAADVEGRKSGIETELASILGAFATHSRFPVVYAGGVHALEDLDLIAGLSRAGIDVTVGSALDLFGGSLSLDALQERASELSLQYI